MNVKPGEAVDLTTVLAEVADLERLVISVNVPAAELVTIRADQVAEVQTDTSGKSVSGSVTFISPQIDAKTGTAVVRIAIPPNAALRPGQFLTVRIVSQEHQDCLAVPDESVTKDSDGATMIALVQGDKAVQKPVKTGLRDGHFVEVEADGLQADMKVVTEGAYGLPKETKIRVLGE